MFILHHMSQIGSDNILYQCICLSKVLSIRRDMYVMICAWLAGYFLMSCDSMSTNTSPSERN